MLSEALSWLGITSSREPSYSPARGEWNPSDTSRGVDRVELQNGDRQDSTHGGHLGWLSGGCQYPMLDASQRVPAETPGCFRRLGPSLDIAKGGDSMYW